MACASEVVSAALNLVINALDAMGATSEGGCVTLRTGQSREGGWLAVSDNGPGIPPEVQERVFEPFFTTKGEAGTGLGLAMVYASVTRYGGTVHLDSAVGRGTTLTMWFPTGVARDVGDVPAMIPSATSAVPAASSARPH